MIAPLILAAALLQPPAPPAAPPAAAAPATKATLAPLVQWDSTGFTAPTPALETTSITDPGATIVERLLRTGGLLGGGSKGGGGSIAWLVDSGKVNVFKTDQQSSVKSAELPPNWQILDAARKESALLAVTIDANTLRSAAEPLFDAPWMQRIIDRLALSNARTVSLRAALLPPTADSLPPLLELKAVTSARSSAPGTPLKPVTLIAPGWGGTAAEAAAVEGATWAASIRSDAGGIGRIGRDGGVGTWAGLVRLAVDVIGATQSTNAAAWPKEYTVWQDKSAEGLRSLASRLLPRATLACYGSAAAPDLVLVIPCHDGERTDTMTKALDLLTSSGSLASGSGVWTLKATGPLSPRLALAVCGNENGVYLVATIEHDSDHALLQQTTARLRKAN